MKTKNCRKHSLLFLSLSSCACIGTIFPAGAYACDPCALFSASELLSQRKQSWSASVNEQYDDFKAGPDHEADAERVERSNTVHLTIGYQSDDFWGAAISIPHLYDKFSGAKAGDETESGFSDISLIAKAKLPSYHGANLKISSGVYAGIEFPTGDASNFSQNARTEEDGHNEEQAHEGEDEHDHILSHHHPISPAAGVSGRGLTTGSGSYDYVFGAHTFARYDRAFFLGSFQYTKRTEGSFNYQFADDYVWDVGPGYFVSTWDENSVALRAALSGESKAHDRQNGAVLDDSAYNTILVGPEVIYSSGDSWAFNLGIDFAIDSSGDASGSVENAWRVRSGLSVFF